jgi:peptidoglycan hydrolase-like protein with peptidoglycan-binding domain
MRDGVEALASPLVERLPRRWCSVAAGLAALALLPACSGGGGSSAEAAEPGSTVELTAAPVSTRVVSVPSSTEDTADAAEVSTTPAPTTSTTPTTVEPTTTPAPTTTLAPGLEPVPPPLFAVTPLSKGAEGDAVKVLQQRLLDAGFWHDGVDGSYGGATSQAVMAFQKYYGLPEASGNVDQVTADRLNAVQYRAVGQARDGDLIEISLTKQVLFIVRGGRTVWTINVSTGNGKPYTETNQQTGEPISGMAVTPEGLYKVDRERPEGWWDGELGGLYRPKYFRGGIAVHGARNVPNYPASHGCVRVSTVAMDYIWNDNVMPMGSAVWVRA